MSRKKSILILAGILVAAAAVWIALLNRGASQRVESQRSAQRAKRPERAYLASASASTNVGVAGPHVSRKDAFRDALAQLRREWGTKPRPVPNLPETTDSATIIWLETGAISPAPGVAQPAAPQQRTSRDTLPYLVQLDGPVQEQWKARLRDAGCVLRGYIPENTFLAEIAPDQTDRVGDLDFVRAVIPYEPEYKVQPFLREVVRYAADTSQTEDAADREWPRIEVSVQTLAPEDASAVADALRNLKAEVLHVSAGRRWGRVVARIIPHPTFIQTIATLGAVQWVEEVVPRELHNDFAVRAGHLNVTNVWAAYGLTGRRQVIGHADTGLDSGTMTNLHPDFFGRVRLTIARGRPGDWSDTHGHGTHTAGSILGDGSAITGQFRGVAFEAELVHQSVMDAGGGLGGLPMDLYELYLEAYTNAARLHSDSWGASVYGEYNADSRSSDEFMWDYPDMLLIFSAGNEGSDGNSDGVVDRDSIGSPGTAKNLLTVGAAESDRAPGSGGYSSMSWGYAWPSEYPADPIRNDYISQSADLLHQGLAAFSSRGPTDDGRIKPDVVAPGTDVISCRSRRASGSAWGLHPNTNYMFSGGTSMATPLMAGFASLVRQFYMEWRGMTNPSAALVKATIINGGRSLSPGQYGTNATREIPPAPRPNNAEGWGQPDLLETLFPSGNRKLSACDTNVLTTGGTNLYRLYLTGGVTGTVTMAYSDYPGTAGAGKKLVNDLDLLVFDPTGRVYYPNGLSAADRSNNVEGLDFVPPVSGVYTVRVTGFNVPNGPQPYAVVFRGGWVPVFAEPMANTTNTTTPYLMDAWITSLGGGATDTYCLMWNTNGGLRFATSALARVTETVYRGTIPAQPQDTTVYYYFEAQLEGRTYRWPTNAPATLLSFRVTAPVTLAISGSPVEVGVPYPGYGIHTMAQGTVVSARVEAVAAPSGGARWVCAGWVGAGAVSATGAAAAVAFTLTTNSSLTWQWGRQFALIQTSSPAGFLNATSWWNAGAAAGSVTAAWSTAVGSTNWMLAHWLLDGVRQPDSTNVAVNPVSGVTMSTSRVLVAVYLPETQDSDANGMADWWELRYFGATGGTTNDDPDADEFDNLTEFKDRSNPADALSVPAPPVIEHSPLEPTQSTPAPWWVQAAVSDSGAVAAVTLQWSRNGAPWASTGMVQDGGVYGAAIPAPATNGDIVAYRITAADAVGLSATSDPYNISVVYPILALAPRGTQVVWSVAGGTTSLTFNVGNAGNTGLQWSVLFRSSPTNDAGWWTASPTAGLLAAATATNVFVSLSAVGRTNGSVRTLYADWLADDPTQPSNRVTIELRVGEPPTISSLTATNTGDTNGPYFVDVIAGPTTLVDTNASFVLWNTNGGYTSFATSLLQQVTGSLYRALLPGQPVGTQVRYFALVTGTNRLAAREPPNAPYALRQFSVVPAVSLLVTGTPAAVGTVTPPYGLSVWPSGAVITASAPAIVSVSDAERYRLQDWTGTGSVPTSGETTQVTFALGADSVLTWQWNREFRLAQTSNIAGGLSTDTWWTAGATGTTVVAASLVTAGATNYRFGAWYVDGVRRPAVGRAENPATEIIMTTTHVAEAVYYPEQQDTDADGLPDAWLAYYGLTGAQSAPEALYRFDRRMGRELALDGAGAVSIGAPSWSSDSAFSFSFWVRPRTNGGVHGIAGSTGVAHWAVYQQDADLCAAFYTGAGATGLSLEASGIFETNRWRHLAVTYDGAGAAQLWVDGALAATSAVSAAFAGNAEAALGRAWLPGIGVRAFAGRLDAFATWSRALASDEIIALYSRGAWPSNASELRLTFDRDNGNAATDESGHNRHGAYIGTATTAVSSLLWDWSGRGHHGCYAGAVWVSDPVFGEVFYANGTNGAVVPHDARLMPTSQVTVVSRVRPDVLNDWHTIAIKVSDEWWADGYGLYARGDAAEQVAGFVNHYATSSVAASISTGAWRHVASVFDGTNLTLFMEGIPVAQSNVTAGISANTGPLFLGEYAGIWGFIGALREVAIFTNGLATGDVAATQLALDDADGDGWSNLQEYQNGSDPLDTNSVPVAPAISHTPLASPQGVPAPWAVTAMVSNDAPCLSVELWWSRNSGPWNLTYMTFTDSVYRASIPAPGVDGDEFEYRIEANRGAGLVATSGPHSFVVSYPVASVNPTNLELNWLSPGAATSRVVTLGNSGSAPLAWNVSVASAGLRDDVESGAGGWTHGGANDLWHVVTQRHVSATHAWYAGDWTEPLYENGMNAWLMSEPIFVPRGAQLRFRHWIDCEVEEGNPPYAHDGGVVEISTNGTNFEILVPSGGYTHRAHGLYGSPFARDTPIFAGTGGWQQAEFDLTPYAGQTVRIRFRFGSDDAFVAGEGWYVDDVELTPAYEEDSWLGFSATSGIVSAGGASNVSVWLDAAALSDGDARAARLVWMFNDPTQAQVEVPVSLFVGAPLRVEHTNLADTVETGLPYSVSARIEPLGAFDTGSLRVATVWSTNSGVGSWTSIMTSADGLVWTGAIPAQPFGAQVLYYLRAEAGGATVYHPSNAPAVQHMFRVMPPIPLVVTGSPALYGAPSPGYGTHWLAAESTITARAPNAVAGGTWWVCTGWTGSGSVPMAGATNVVSFVLQTGSLVRWYWDVKYLLAQTSAPAGIVSNYSWYAAGAVANTVNAPMTGSLEGVAYRFAEWRVDGVRQGTGKALNPVTGIAMTSAHEAVAVYLPAVQDDDADGLPDAWEQYYFAHLLWSGSDDPDSDGFFNAAELGEGTDPTDAFSVPAPPVIAHTPLADPQTSPAPWMVSAVVTDNVGLAVVPISGGALAFTNVSHYAIRSTMNAFPTSAITVEFWMKSSDRARRGTPFSYAVSGGFNEANEFTLYNANTFLIYRGGVYTNTRVGATDGAWHHIAVTWRGSDGRARLYKDGLLEFESTLAAGTTIRPSGILVLGQDQDSYGGGFNADDAFQGLLDEVRVWNLERDVEAIRSTISNRLTGTETGLVSYWTMDEGTGALATDAARSGNDLTLMGVTWTNSDALAGPSVKLFYNRNSNGWQSVFMSAGSNHAFTATLPPPARNADRFEYRIEAADIGGLVSTSGIHAFTVALPEIVYAPSSLTNVWLVPDGVTNRLLVLSNAGPSTLRWQLTTEPYGLRDAVESGTNGWTSGGSGNQWHITSRRAFSPNFAWFFGDESAGTYANNADAFLDTPPVSLGPGARLTVRHWPDLEMQSTTVAWDGGIVEISTNGGIAFSKLTPIGGYPYTVNGGWGQPFPGGSGVFAGWGGWTQSVFDLSAYAGAEAILRFHVGSDVVNDYAPEGWFIDDVVITPDPGTTSWFSASAVTGALAAGGATNIVLTFDAAGLNAGDAVAQKLILISDDPVMPGARIPLVLRIGLQPVIEHRPLGNQPITSTAYVVEATITPAEYVNTNALYVLWNTNGVGHPFMTAALVRVTGDVYRAQIPAQPPGTRVSYYLLATTGADVTSVDPPGAPANFHSFEVVPMVLLSVTGTPAAIGSVVPDYGVHSVASGAVVIASAAPSEATSGVRYAAWGWTGSGSVPAYGDGASVTFTCRVDSTLNWQWATQFLLTQTSNVRGGVSTGTWWFAGSTAETAQAAESLPDRGTNYMFAHWLVDGVRQPDSNSIAVNPAGGLIMETARVAAAVYVAEFVDSDGDDIPDWWELRYFGSLTPWRTNDPDNDGFTNLDEYRDRTNPRDAASYPRPPNIAHDPLADPQTTPPPWSVSAVVTDNWAVADVMLRWRRNGESWQSAAMTNGITNTFWGVVSGIASNGDTYSYFIEAHDAGGWASTAGPFTVHVAIGGLRVSPTNFGHIFLPPNAGTSLVLQIWNEGGAELTWTARMVRVGFGDGVEDGTNDWTHSGTGDRWHISSHRAASGARSWYAGSGDTRLYGNNMNASLVSPSFELPTDAVLYVASYIDAETKNENEAYDGGVVELSVTGGTFFAIAPRAGYPYRIAEDSDGPFTNGTRCLAGTGQWQQLEFDLSAWAGHSVQVRFRFGSDSSKVREGWYVDDIFVAPGTGDGTWLQLGATSGSLPAAWASVINVAVSTTGKLVATWWPAEIAVIGSAGAGAWTIPITMVVYGEATDFDADGMPDVWELAFDLNPANAADAMLDGDGDGFSNVAEYWAGTDPWNASSHFRITQGQLTPVLRVQFEGVSGRMYRLQSSSNLMNAAWSNVAERLSQSNALQWLEHTNAPYAPRYYRLAIEQP